MTQSKLQSTKTKSKFLKTVTVRNKKFYYGAAIGVLIIAAPFLIHIVDIVPEGTDKWQVGPLTIIKGPYIDVQSYVYIFLTKFFLFFTFSIWFLTCKHWWRWSLIVPLWLAIHQLYAVVNNNIQVLDEFNYVTSSPVVIVVLLLHIIVARKLKFLNDSLDVKEQIDAEIQDFINN